MTETALDTRSTTNAWRVGALVAAVALPANLVVWLVADAAGVPFEVTQGGDTQSVGPLMVIVMTLAPLLLGTLLLWATRSRAPRSWTVLAWVGLAVGLLSAALPLSVDASDGTSLSLAAMHVVVGLAWFGAVRRGSEQR